MSHAPRRFDRSDLQLKAKLKQGEDSYACHIVNISAGGAKLRLASDASLAEGVDVVLDLDRLGSFPATVVWRTNKQLGIHFILDHEAMAKVVMSLAM
jgi:hypothetical protein